MSCPKPLIIVGASGLGREILWLVRALPEQWEPIGFLDDNEELDGQTLCGLPVLGRIDDSPRHAEAWFITALGIPRTRKQVVERLTANGDVKFATLVHPSVPRFDYVQVGEGTTIAALSVISTNIVIGRHCLINCTSTVGHDSTLGDYCSTAPHAAISGNVTLGCGVEIGTSAVLVPGVTVGDGAMIGAGSVISKPVEPNTAMVGLPARKIRTLEPFFCN